MKNQSLKELVISKIELDLVKSKFLEEFNNIKNDKNLIKSYLLNYNINNKLINSFTKLGFKKEAEYLLKEYYNFIEDEKKNIFFDNVFHFLKYLEAISIFLEKFKEKKEIKHYLKQIEHFISEISKNFDDVYLLVYSEKLGVKKYNLENNLLLTQIFSKLSDLLNEFDFTDKADKFYIQKEKINLGINRYFLHSKYESFIFSFDSNKNFVNLNEDNLVKVFNYILLDEEVKKGIKKVFNIKKLKNLDKFNLVYLDINESLKKNISKKEKNLDFENIDIMLKFPKLILSEKEFNEYEIKMKSLFKLEEIKIEKTNKYYLVEPFDFNELIINIDYIF
jgi:hypothetical protein